MANVSEQKLSEIIKLYERKILAVCKTFPDGITDPDLRQHCPLSNARMTAMNGLVSSGRIRLYQDGTTIIYKEVSQEDAALYHGLSPEDITVLEIIKNSANKGEWQSNIKFKSKLQQKQVTNILAKLKTKNIIKSVKTIHGKKKIVYMLASIEPSREITGGLWYTGTDFNLTLIQDLQKKACGVICQKKQCTVSDVLGAVKTMGLTDNIELQEEDMQTIIDTLVYDGLIEKSFDPRSNLYIYKEIKNLTPENAFSEIPCSTCPVFEQCTENGDVNPQSCVYLKQWIEF
ncbi:DNA-directed RNA polymerase III subunit RPC6 [Acrasis kona]|uniref:DNA-directed RNA polymerase III subunit RPC6 n=1 Tax=Acrasis kona TaxID=1008807 RepID=A0AAW2ZL71_9EUKA